MRRLFALAVASMAALATCAVPVRSNMGGFLGGHIPQSANAPTVLDYVQDGLVACFDGIENVGVGEHDSTATTWVDLCTGESASPYGTGVSFGDTYAYFDGYGYIDANINTVPLFGDLTVEVVSGENVATTQNGGAIFSSKQSPQSNYFLKLDVYNAFTRTYWGIANFIGNFGTTANKTSHLFWNRAVTVTGTSFVSYVNGVANGSKT